MWHSNINGIFVQHGQMKIGIILRCCKMKTLFGCMMTGVLLWLCCMIVKEYILGCWMDVCVWLKCIPCDIWWPLKMAQMVWKMDFDGLMDWEKLKFFSTDHEFHLMVVWQSHYNYLGGVCLWINHVWNFWKHKKCIFNFFVSQLISTLFPFLGGYDWGNLWDLRACAPFPTFCAVL